MPNSGSVDLKMFEHGLQPEHAVHFIDSRNLAEANLRSAKSSLPFILILILSSSMVIIRAIYTSEDISIVVAGILLLSLVSVFLMRRSIKKSRKRIKYFEDLINQCYSGKSSS
jgi:hypothetical protein